MQRFTILVSISFLLIPFSVFAISKTEISDGTVHGLYHLEDVVDSSSAGLNLTDVGGVSFTAAKLNNGADFGNNNTSLYLEQTTPVLTWADLGGAYSIAFWVHPHLLADGKRLVFNETASSTSRRQENLYLYKPAGTTFIEANFYPATGNVEQKLDSVSSLATNVWHHVVLVNTGSHRELWVDGVDEASSTFGLGTATGSNNKTDLGAHNDGAGTVDSFFSGHLDEVVFVKRALTPTEIASLYNAGAGSEVCTTVGCGSPTTPTSSTPTFIQGSTGNCTYSWAYNASGTVSTTTQTCTNSSRPIEIYLSTIIEIFVFCISAGIVIRYIT